MSKLYGMVSENGGATGATKAASRHITAWLQTEWGRVTLNLDADGGFTLTATRVEHYQACEGTGVAIVAGSLGSRLGVADKISAKSEQNGVGKRRGRPRVAKAEATA